MEELIIYKLCQTYLPPSPKKPTRELFSVTELEAEAFTLDNSTAAAEYNSVNFVSCLEVIFIVRANIPPSVCTPMKKEVYKML